MRAVDGSEKARMGGRRWAPIRRLAAVALASVELLGTAASARAADDERPASDDATHGDDAAALVERGIALRRAGDDAGALELFQKAERLDSASVRIKVHLAATYQSLGDWEEADRYLRVALRDPSDPYIEQHQAVLLAAQRTIDAHIASLLITGGPRGAQVRLNGRLLGTLPIDQTLRIGAGIYTLEATLPGHYPITRSVALAGGELLRENVQLAALATGGESAPASAAESPSHWLSWTLGGLAVGAGALTVTAWAIGRAHADTWNDNSRCLAPGQTRQQVCGNERQEGERAQTWMWVGAASTLALAGASVATLWLSPRSSETSPTAFACGAGIGALTCAGRF